MPIIKCYNEGCSYWDRGQTDNCAHAYIQIQKCYKAKVEKRDNVRDDRFYFRELMSEQCQCGKTKKSGHSFCWGCYSCLPRELQRRLYLRIGDGYEEAYDEAAKELSDEIPS